MAEKSSFFNSVGGDRKYQAVDFATYFGSFIGNGVFPNPSTNLQVLANDNMTLTIKAGSSWINGYMYLNSSDLVYPIGNADGVLNRIDRIVIRLDYLNREIKAHTKSGVYASIPTAPALQRDSDIYEIALADIIISAGMVSITQSSVTDLRLSDLCGVVHGVVNQVDTSTIFAQYQQKFEEWFAESAPDMLSQFNVWFDYIKNRLEDVEVGALAIEIDEVKAAQGTHLADDMPHQTTDGVTTYKWGMAYQNGVWGILYEEVV